MNTLSPSGVSLPRVALSRPTGLAWAKLAPRFEQIVTSGRLTDGCHVRELEATLAQRLGVSHCVAVASCTAGLLIVLRAAGLSGEMVIPGFTFSATGHALLWNGLAPVLADAEPERLTVSPAAVEKLVGPDTSAVMATHLYGNPCDVMGLADVARRRGLRLFYDAAPALGATHAGRPMGGFGEAEVFSLSPTKPVVAVEGGIIATNHEALAQECIRARNYGQTPGRYESQFPGLNARMSELHAAVALVSLETLDERINRRHQLATALRDKLNELPLEFLEAADGDRSTHKDLVVVLDPAEAGARNEVVNHLAALGVECRTYHDPPLHRHPPYRRCRRGELPVIEDVSPRVLTLPLPDDMTDDELERVLAALRAYWG